MLRVLHQMRIITFMDFTDLTPKITARIRKDERGFYLS